MNQLGQSIQALLKLNRRYSDEYVSEGPERAEYISNHPTTVVGFQCMDGRINLPVITGTPLGLMIEYRNIGGMFDFGWQNLSDDFRPIRKAAKATGAHVLVLATYHYSAGSVMRGCAGFNHDRQASFDWMVRFRNQIKRCYAPVVYPIVVGIETDTDTIILHGVNEREAVKISDLANKGGMALLATVMQLYPDIPTQVALDLVPLLQGNLAHIEVVKGRPLSDLVHREWVLGVGCGFDWLHLPNTAIIVGPRSPEMQASILKALKIIMSNFEAGRIESGQFVMIASAVAEDEDDFHAAKERASYLGHLTRNLVQENLPREFARLMHRIHVVVNQSTRRMQVVLEQKEVKDRRGSARELRAP